jgi:hypothetical protein
VRRHTARKSWTSYLLYPFQRFLGFSLSSQLFFLLLSDTINDSFAPLLGLLPTILTIYLLLALPLLSLVSDNSIKHLQLIPSGHEYLPLFEF